MGNTKKYRSIIKVMPAIYLALYFLLNGTFLHVHEYEGEVVSHAHPFSGNSHTEGVAKLILAFNSTPINTAPDIALPKEFAECTAILTVQYESDYSGRVQTTSKLRGPPAYHHIQY